MKTKIGMLLLFGLLLVSRVPAELPFYLSIDTSGGYSFTGEAFFIENQVTLGKNFDVLSGLFVEGGNGLGYDEEFSDEIFLGAGISFFDWLNFSLYPVLAVAPEVDFYLCPALTFSWEFEDAGITLSDANELAIYVLYGEIEYANTFDFNVSFDIARNTSFNIGLSNQFGWAGEIAESVSAGLGMDISFFSFALNYDFGILPEIDHGMGLDISFYFE